MARWAQLWMATWDDEAFKPLTPDGRLLFLWTWSNPIAAIGGLYVCSVRAMTRALGDPQNHPNIGELEQRVEVALEELAAKPLVSYDYDQEVVWVVNRAKHAVTSDKVAVRVKREVEVVPPSPLKDRFLEAYARKIGWPK